MGRDKALVEVGGRPLAGIAVDALRGARAAEVLAIGGDEPRLSALGVRWIPDGWPGEGPLGAVITALAAAGEDVTVVLSCDLPAVVPAAVTAVLTGLAGVEAAVAVADGRRQPLLAAYRSSCAPALEAMFRDGERSPSRALGRLSVAEVALADPAWSLDVDTPDALSDDRFLGD
jgi:molybdopterin-guanine dinucleotide biosynthesis protein A